ncbi:MAG: protein phosphatase 2C domain-containing protein, partial [Anaerolineales bacterium]
MSALIHCPNCAANNPPNAAKCAYCQAPLPVPAKEQPPSDFGGVLEASPGVEIARASPDRRPAFPPREPGAHYFHNRFQVSEYLGTQSGCHFYQVLDNAWALRCINPTCKLFGVRQSGDRPGLCPECATPLESYQAHLLLREADSPDVFGTAIEVAARGVHHPALLTPLVYFEESDTVAVRCCLVVPELPTRFLSDLTGKQDVVKVLQWGSRLGRGLQALHQSNILYGNVRADKVAFVESGPAWSDFTTVQVLPGTGPLLGMAAQMRAEFRSLAAILWTALTGLDEYDPQAPVAPRLHRVFASWLGADATEPDPAGWLQALSNLAVQPVGGESRLPSFDLISGRATHTGRVRELNEDSMLVIEMSGNSSSYGRALGLYAIADGMGGHAAGEIASGMAISTLARRAQAGLFSEAVFADIGADDIIAWLKEAVAAANEAVHAHRVRTQSNLGTTLVMAVINGMQAYTANVGDSRVYRLASNGLEQITTDHSLIERLVASRHVAPEDAASHPQRSVIYKSIGERSEIEPDVVAVKLEAGDRLLVCSDGLNAMLADEEISARLAAAPP